MDTEVNGIISEENVSSKSFVTDSEDYGMTKRKGAASHMAVTSYKDDLRGIYG